MKTKATPESRIRRLAATNTAPQIARRVGWSQARVRRYCKRHDIEIKPGQRSPLAAAGADAVRTKLVKLLSIEAVATHYGVTRQAVYAFLERHA